jgi:hypothetical protein
VVDVDSVAPVLVAEVFAEDLHVPAPTQMCVCVDEWEDSHSLFTLIPKNRGKGTYGSSHQPNSSVRTHVLQLKPPSYCPQEEYDTSRQMFLKLHSAHCARCS